MTPAPASSTAPRSRRGRRYTLWLSDAEREDLEQLAALFTGERGGERVGFSRVLRLALRRLAAIRLSDRRASDEAVDVDRRGSPGRRAYDAGLRGSER